MDGMVVRSTIEPTQTFEVRETPLVSQRGRSTELVIEAEYESQARYRTIQTPT